MFGVALRVVDRISVKSFKLVHDLITPDVVKKFASCLSDSLAVPKCIKVLLTFVFHCSISLLNLLSVMLLLISVVSFLRLLLALDVEEKLVMLLSVAEIISPILHSVFALNASRLEKN